MTTWDDLVSTALVGTERRPFPETVAAGAAAVLGAPLPAAPPELSVLAAAGVLGTHRRAGWVAPHHDGDRPAPAPADDRALASPTSVQLLELLLDGGVPVAGGSAPLVAEWLQRCAAGRRRVPERLLPRLLAAATVDRSLQDGAISVGGTRAGWLAERNPDWAWVLAPGTQFDALPPDIDATWRTGDREARTALLATLRRARPDDARALLASTWSTESAVDRAALVTLLHVNLAPADEPFLEAALDDRSKVVRERAARLLARLPTSALARRMATRLRELVAVGGLLRKKLEVTLPEEPDVGARRDGIRDEGAPPKTGQRAWWLQQIVAATPLSFWATELHVDALTVARLADSRELLVGLAQAARHQHDSTWAAALLDHHADASLLTVLAPDDVELAAATLLATATDAQLTEVVTSIPGPWALATSRAVVTRLRRAKTTGPLQQSVGALVTRLHPSAATEIERWVDDLRDDDAGRRHVRGLAHALSIRQTIAQELP